MQFVNLKGISTVTLCIISWIIILFLLSILIPLFCLMIPYKWLVNLVVYWRHPNWLPLTGPDVGCIINMDLYKKEGKLLGSLGAAIVIDADVDIQDFRKTVQDKLLNVLANDSERNGSRKYKYDRLRRYPIKFMSHYYWSGEIRDLDVKTVVKERQTSLTTDLETCINKWLHKGYEDECPIWEIMVYKDKDEYKGKTVVAIKMAHALGDGYSGRALAAVLFLKNQNPIPLFAQENLLSSSQRWLHPKEILIFITMGPYLSLKFLATCLLHSDLLTESNHLTESVTGFTTVKRDAVTKIRRAYACKFNDVLFALFGNAIRRYFLESITENELPKSILFSCSREIPNRPGLICNHVTQQLFPVPIAIPDLPQRLIKLKTHSKEVFQYSSYKLFHYLGELPYYIPAFLFKASDTARVGFSCALAPIPQVPDLDYVDKYPVINSYALAGQQIKQLAFFATSVTRGEFLDLALLGNCGVFQNQAAMNRLKTYVHQELQLLLETVEEMTRNHACGTSIIIPQ